VWGQGEGSGQVGVVAGGGGGGVAGVQRVWVGWAQRNQNERRIKQTEKKCYDAAECGVYVGDAVNREVYVWCGAKYVRVVQKVRRG